MLTVGSSVVEFARFVSWMNCTMRASCIATSRYGPRHAARAHPVERILLLHWSPPPTSAPKVHSQLQALVGLLHLALVRSVDTCQHGVAFSVKSASTGTPQQARSIIGVTEQPALRRAGFVSHSGTGRSSPKPSEADPHRSTVHTQQLGVPLGTGGVLPVLCVMPDSWVSSFWALPSVQSALILLLIFRLPNPQHQASIENDDAECVVTRCSSALNMAPPP